MLTLGTFLARTIATAPPLAYRGCVACGEFDIDDIFVLGPAIDEAAEMASQAEGAFVWLTPRTRDLFEALQIPGTGEFAPHLPSYHAVFNSLAPFHNVPLKKGNHLLTRVINPLAAWRPEVRSDLTSRLMQTFDSRDIVVQEKASNTREFLAQAQAVQYTPLFDLERPFPISNEQAHRR
jgi:hypothetical protein